MDYISRLEQMAVQEGALSAKEYLKNPNNHNSCENECTAFTLEPAIKSSYLTQAIPKFTKFIKLKRIFADDPEEQEQLILSLSTIFNNSFDNKMNKLKQFVEDKKKVGRKWACGAF